jgi:hypothetical protein
MMLYPLPPYSHDRHCTLDDFQKPVRRLEARHRRPVEPQRLGQFVVEHRLAGYRQHPQGAKPADLPVQQVMLIMSATD